MLISMLRTIILYAVILAAMRLMGKRQVSQMQTSELVVTLLISELAVIPIQEYNAPILMGIAPMAVLVVFEIFIAVMMMKSDKFRELLCGKPIVVIKDGKVNQKAMKRLRMTTEELSEHLRQNGVFYLDEAEYAVIETNGLMSVMKRADEDIITPAQAGIKVKQKPIEVIVITDGVIAESSLSVCNQTKHWVEKTLQDNRVKLEDVFIMTGDANGKYRIIKKDKK